MAAAEIKKARFSDPVVQFSIFVENKVGRLLETINLLADRDIHVMAITTMDTTDSAILRMVVDDPDSARQLLFEHGLAHAETEVLVVELNGATEVQQVLCIILQAEINVHYTYAFISRPQGRGALAIHLEDLELGSQALIRHGHKVLGQADISR
ncbi:MAG: acetolactate synthase [Verrucomicrobiota bacterium]